MGALSKKKANTSRRGGQAAVRSTKTVKTIRNMDGGGVATQLSKKSELFLTSVATFAGKDNFYESSDDRVERVIGLVEKLTNKDPEWMQAFMSWLRTDGNIRTLSIMIAVEYALAGGPDVAQVIDSVCQRADEPAEFLAYYISRNYGRKNLDRYPLKAPRLPQAVRKGLERAAIRLYDEYAVLKYNGSSRTVKMADVLNLVHPRVSQYPVSYTSEQVAAKRELFRYIVASHYDPKADFDAALLPMVAQDRELRKLGREDVLKLSTDELRTAGITHERMGAMLNGPWTDSAWENIIPTMGYMALLRNLRNFDEIKISNTVVDSVCKRLADPERVAKSRQLPFRFFSAYKALSSDNYSLALTRALDASLVNVPVFEGKTLVLLDVSGSMDMVGYGPSHNGVRKNIPDGVMPWEIGGLFALAIAYSSPNVDFAIFGTHSKKVPLPKGGSVLKTLPGLYENHGVGHGTNIYQSIEREFDGHDRVVVFTDMQDNGGSGWGYGENVTEPGKFPQIPFIHYFDVSGYGQGAANGVGSAGRYQYGGFTDATMAQMKNLEAGASESWPWED